MSAWVCRCIIRSWSAAEQFVCHSTHGGACGTRGLQARRHQPHAASALCRQPQGCTNIEVHHRVCWVKQAQQARTVTIHILQGGVHLPQSHMVRAGIGPCSKHFHAMPCWPSSTSISRHSRVGATAASSASASMAAILHSRMQTQSYIHTLDWSLRHCSQP